MRVLLDGRFLQDHFPGIGRYTSHLVREIPRLPDIDLWVLRDPTAANHRFDWDDLTRTGARVVERWCGIFSPRDQVSFNAQARCLRPDVIHFPYPVRPYAVPRPTVVTIHDTIPLRWPDLLPRRRDRLLFPVIVRLAAAASRIVLTDSQAARDDIVSLVGVPERKIRVAPIGIPPRPPEAVRPPDAAGRHLLFVGVNKPHKNLPHLIEAYAASGVDLPLVLAGPEDPRYPAARQTAERLGVADRVRLLGFVDDATLARLYREAAIFVFPSRAEGFGIPVLEALASGVPVIASDLPVLREVAGDAARYVNPLDVAGWAEAIARLTGDRDGQAKLSLAGRERAAVFDPRRTAALVVEAYRDAVAS